MPVGTVINVFTSVVQATANAVPLNVVSSRSGANLEATIHMQTLLSHTASCTARCGGYVIPSIDPETGNATSTVVRSASVLACPFSCSAVVSLDAVVEDAASAAIASSPAVPEGAPLKDDELAALREGHARSSIVVSELLESSMASLQTWVSRYCSEVFTESVKGMDGAALEFILMVNDTLPAVLTLQSFLTWLDVVVAHPELPVTEPWVETSAIRTAASKAPPPPPPSIANVVSRLPAKGLSSTDLATMVVPSRPDFIRDAASKINVMKKAIESETVGVPTSATTEDVQTAWTSVYGITFPVSRVDDDDTADDVPLDTSGRFILPAVVSGTQVGGHGQPPGMPITLSTADATEILRGLDGTGRDDAAPHAGAGSGETLDTATGPSAAPPLSMSPTSLEILYQALASNV